MTMEAPLSQSVEVTDTVRPWDANEDDDQLARKVHWLLGVPVDEISMAEAVEKIATAMERRSPLLFATPNLNFLTTAQRDPEFRESLIACDLCTADGISIAKLARILGVLLRERVAGSDIFESLKVRPRASRELSVFLFGGVSGVAEAACRALNNQGGSLRCAGWLHPGFADVAAMSTPDIIDRINASGADFLLVSLGALKGQQWLDRNHDRLTVPVRAHLGATLNFQAGRVARAPASVRKLGLEWLWRIKEEPHLWRRYWDDGTKLLRNLSAEVVPLTLSERRLRLQGGSADLSCEADFTADAVRIRLVGAAIAAHIEQATLCFRQAVQARKPTVVDLSGTKMVDPRFLGLLVMLRKEVVRHGNTLECSGATPGLERIFRRHRAGFLVSAGQSGS